MSSFSNECINVLERYRSNTGTKVEFENMGGAKGGNSIIITDNNGQLTNNGRGLEGKKF